MSMTPQYYGQPGPPNDEHSGKATAGFVLGLVGLLAWCCPLVGLPVTIVGLVMSVKGLQSSRRSIAMAGLILSIIGVVLAVINAAVGAYQGAHGTNWLQQWMMHH